jgi:hypothetical protein
MKTFGIGTVGRIVIGACALGAAGFIVATAHPTIARSAYGAGFIPTTTCNLPTPCVTDTNNGAGSGLLGKSKGGAGLTGSTSFVSAGGFKNGKAGVSGTDTSTTGTGNSGVSGSSTNGPGVYGNSTSFYGIVGLETAVGFAGVVGQTLNASATSGSGSMGVYGLDNTTDGGTKNSGVEGFSNSGTGVTAVSTSGPGVNAFTTSAGAAVFGTTFNPSGTDLFSSYGISGGDASSDGGTKNGGVFGSSTHGVGVYGKGATGVRAQAAAAGNLVFEGLNAAGTSIAHLDDTGNLHLSGKVFTSGSCSTGCMNGGGIVRRPVAYVPSQSLPTMEDFGDAQLVNGRTYVRLDIAFANRIDTRAIYMVFITPDGDTNGLYVANRTPSGFEVRENHGGKSTVGFSYRIVAKPFGDSSARLPMDIERTTPSHVPALRPPSAVKRPPM